MIDRLAKNEVVELREPGQFARLVNFPGSFDAPIHFLNGNDVRLTGTDDTGDALEIELAVDTFSVVNVVGEDLEAGRVAKGRGASNERQAKSQKANSDDLQFVESARRGKLFDETRSILSETGNASTVVAAGSRSNDRIWRLRG